ncbi:MAG: DUF5309 family protein [Pseudomonadota bacterium]|nr:DUF5309 family protein [Pseudomonadota bacterium]
MDHSYSYAQVKRDLADALSIVMQSEPSLLGLINHDGAAGATKHEWMDDKLVAETDALNGAVLVGANTFVVDGGAKFLADMVLAADGYDEVVRVSAVSGDDLTVVRGYGGTTAVAIADNTVIRIVSRPRPEATEKGDDPGREPTPFWNQREIFDFTARVSKTAQAVGLYGIDDAVDFKVQHGLQVLARRFNLAMIYGVRVQRDASDNGSLGGFHDQIRRAAGVIVDAAAAAISDTILNNAIESIVGLGGRPNALWCNTNQARKISAFDSTNLQVVREDQRTGRAVYEFVSDLPMGIIPRIVVDQNYPKTKLGVVDTTRLRWMPLNARGLSDEDATPPGADYVARRMLGEYRFEVHNADSAHALIENLSQ